MSAQNKSLKKEAERGKKNKTNVRKNRKQESSQHACHEFRKMKKENNKKKTNHNSKTKQNYSLERVDVVSVLLTWLKGFNIVRLGDSECRYFTETS